MVWEYVANRIMRISSLSTDEFVCISATFWSMLHEQSDQKKILLERGFTPEQVDKLNIQVPVVEIKDLLRFTVPLSRFEYSNMGYLLTLLENYERGNLPYPGSVSEQPGQVMDILNLLLALKQKSQTAQIARQDNHGRYNKNKSGASR